MQAKETTMAIALEFIDFIVPRKVIEAKYPGGWKRCLADHGDLLQGRVWYDEHLFRDGAMSPQGIEALVSYWSEHGLEPFADLDGHMVWQDCCVVEGMFGGPTLPCDWIEISDDGRSAFLKGTEPGEVISSARDG
jgi:hypothetical protein